MMPRVRWSLLQPVPSVCRGSLGVVLLAAVLLGVGGCQPVVAPSAENDAAYPPDFSLVFTVHGSPDADAGRDLEPRHRSAQHVITPDRLLRVALGPGVHADLYPPATAKISIERMALLYRLASAAQQTGPADAQPPTNPAASAPTSTTPTAPTPGVLPTAPITYRLTLTGHGQHWTYDTHPRQNAAATALLDELIRLRGGR